MTSRGCVRIYTDGGARGNPGPAAIGIVICDKDDKLLKEYKEFIGVTTNNQAEYRAVIKGLEKAIYLTDNEVLLVSDSELVVRQINGEYRVKKRELKPLFEAVIGIISRFKSVRFEHRPRMTGWLERADQLVNDILDIRRF